ncbi:hypothetical protein DBZ36_10095 [Alginatibacterium sediminis]|uniref:Invasion associated locus B family protein n=1 Tax=Alginatibacterium sediminis TaxID=2164068 RepID=A0A420EDC6_9ALTE|nr:invasion associated locus B family protein [Alginatibacterium sediminis]RKF18739.1 hypothetical protein DBZ36_10095 [Alginatibacterium sediminis]
MPILIILTLSLFNSFAFAEQELEPVWKSSCDQQQRCNATLPVVVENQGQKRVVAGLTYLYNPPGDILRIRFSPKATRGAGIGLKVDQNKALQLPISNCDDKVCEVNIAVDTQLLNELRGGQWMLLAYQENTKQRTLPIQIFGFNAVYEQWNQAREKPTH